jgi:hypothetical protein
MGARVCYHFHWVDILGGGGQKLVAKPYPAPQWAIEVALGVLDIGVSDVWLRDDPERGVLNVRAESYNPFTCDKVVKAAEEHAPVGIVVFYDYGLGMCVTPVEIQCKTCRRKADYGRDCWWCGAAN